MTTQAKTINCPLLTVTALLGLISTACVIVEEPFDQETSASSDTTGDGDGDGDGDSGDGDGDGDGDSGDGDGDTDTDGDAICPGSEEFCTSAESHCDDDGILQICQYIPENDCIEHFVVDCEDSVGAGSMCVTVSPTEGGCTEPAPACGDGNVDEGEECDDGNGDDLDGCSASCELEARRVFATSTLHDGNLGGLAGADQICNELAANAGLPGVYMAWLSTSQPGEQPLDRFVHSEVPYVLVDGTVVASDWDTLVTDGTLMNLIVMTEDGGPAPSGNACAWSPDATLPVMSATNYGGDLVITFDEPLDYSTCSDWTSTSSGGHWGYADDPEFGKWSGGCADNSPDACANTAALYCFEQ